MRKVFSSNDLSETVLVRDALVQHGLEVTILNEYSGQSAIPEFRPPADIWVKSDGDYERARQCVVDTLSTLDSKSEARPWKCPRCEEENPQSFEMCWNCGQDKKGAVD